MLDFPRWKTISISIILLLGVIFSIPSFLPEKTLNSLPTFLQAKVNLGLDLAGGSHLLLEADIDDLRKTQLTNMEKTVRTAMRGERGPDDDIAIGELSPAGGKISFLIRDQKQLDDARDRLFSQTQGAAMTGQRLLKRHHRRFDRRMSCHRCFPSSYRFPPYLIGTRHYCKKLAPTPTWLKCSLSSRIAEAEGCLPRLDRRR